MKMESSMQAFLVYRGRDHPEPKYQRGEEGGSKIRKEINLTRIYVLKLHHSLSLVSQHRWSMESNPYNQAPPKLP
jgi:hypothetical protein